MERRTHDLQTQNNNQIQICILPRPVRRSVKKWSNMRF